MSRMVLAEQAHIINALAPVDINGGVNSAVWSMKNAAHATIIIKLGVTGAASTVTVQECDDFTPSASTAIGFSYYAEDTASGDQLDDRATVENTGFATSTNNGIFYVIEIDAEQLTEGYPCLRVCFSNPGQSTFADVTVVLTGYAYQGKSQVTEIA